MGVQVRKRTDPILFIFFVSGFSGLIYESVWTHYLRSFVGHAAYAQTLVLGVFIGGLALGSWLCARVAEKVRNPLRVYAAVEGAIGVVALVFHAIFLLTTEWSYATLLPAACDPGGSVCFAQWAVAALLLAPQSILLGATFPLVCSAVLRLAPEQPGEEVSALYFLNSFGAVLGVLASAFMLIPTVGLPGTLTVAGMLNIAVAMVAYFLSKTPPPALHLAQLPQAPSSALGPRLAILLLATAGLTGLSSFIYEIAWIRMLSLVLGASTYSFEIMLASFILGLALGGLWVRHRVDQLEEPVRFLAIVQIVMGVSAAATVVVYIGSFDLMAWLLSAVARNNVIFSLASTLIALLVMLPATFCAGMTLPLITYRLLRSPTGEKAIGAVYAVNTLGALLGVGIAVHLLLDNVGLRWTLIAGAAIDVALGVVLLAIVAGRRTGRLPLPWPAIAGVVALAAMAFTFDIDPRRSASGVFRTGVAHIGDGDTVAYHHDGKTATVDVTRNVAQVVSIRTNGKPDAAISVSPDRFPTGDEFTMTLLAVLPLGHRPDAKTAAVIGFGSGMSTSVILGSPKLQRVDTIEIEPSMVEGAKQFRPTTEAAYSDPRSRIVIDDAKSYFARSHERYDIIVSEPSNPWVSGVASLFSEEFYRRASHYMNDGAVFSQWLHTYEMDAETLSSILTAVAKTFPEFLIYSSIDSDIILIARKGGTPGRFDEAVLKYPGLQPMLKRLRLTEAEVVQRRAVGSWNTLAPFFESLGSPSNSDYFPFVDHRAGRTRFTRAHVNELIELQSSGVPLLEMLDGSSSPVAKRHDMIPITVIDVAVRKAWAMHDGVLALGAARDATKPIETAQDSAARLVRLWAGCRSELAFEQMLPSLRLVAEATIPYLQKDSALEIWRFVAQSPCVKSLPPEHKRWIELFEAVAERNQDAMIAKGAAILDATKTPPNEASEYAFLATATALMCKGERAKALLLFERAKLFVRRDAHPSEIRLIAALTDSRYPAFPRAGCRPRS